MSDEVDQLINRFSSIDIDDTELITNSNEYIYNHKISALRNFVELCGYKNSPKIVLTSIFNEYPKLQLGNGHTWGRKDVVRKTEYKIFVVYSNKDVAYRWDNVSKDDIRKVKNIAERFCVNTKGIRRIEYVGILGVKSNSDNTNRSIRKDIRDYYKTQPCCVCGSNTDLECDHKNDLYNDPRVLNITTQTFDDFQSLCKHCNDQKRQVAKETRRTMKRYAATNIKSMAIFGIDFVEGDEKLDMNDVNAMVGTYWYDPIYFTKMVSIMMRINATKEFLELS